jgi:uncharacterized Zn finger protein
MATCKACGDEFAPADLIRHDSDRVLVVHCPACGAFMGSYRHHGDRVSADTAPSDR